VISAKAGGGGRGGNTLRSRSSSSWQRCVSLSPNLPAHEALCFRADGNRGNRVAELPVETGQLTKGALDFSKLRCFRLREGIELF